MPITLNTIPPKGGEVVRALITVGELPRWYSRHAGDNLGAVSGDVDIADDLTITRVRNGPESPGPFFAFNTSGAGNLSTWFANNSDKQIFLAFGDEDNPTNVKISVSGNIITEGAGWWVKTITAAQQTFLDAVAVGDAVNLVIADAELPIAASFTATAIATFNPAVTVGLHPLFGIVPLSDQGFRYITEPHVLQPQWSGLAAARYPASHVGILQAPLVHWRSPDRTQTDLIASFDAQVHLHGLAIIDGNAPVQLIGSGQTLAMTRDPIDGKGKSIITFAPRSLNRLTLRFAANTPTLDNADFYRIGAVVLLGRALTTLDNAPLRPSPEEWHIEEEENLEERQRLLPPETIVDWEARPQTEADYLRWLDLVYRRDLRDLVLWQLADTELILGRFDGDVEREDYALNYGYWRMRWLVL